MASGLCWYHQFQTDYMTAWQDDQLAACEPGLLMTKSHCELPQSSIEATLWRICILNKQQSSTSSVVANKKGVP